MEKFFSAMIAHLSQWFAGGMFSDLAADLILAACIGLAAKVVFVTVEIPVSFLRALFSYRDPLAGLEKAFESDFGAFFDEISPDPFVQTGSLPASVRLDLVVYRYHPKEFFFGGERFYQSFFDAREKANQQRFGGSTGLVGQYFSASPDGARHELSHYNVDVNSRHLLAAHICLDNVFDLTYEDNIKLFFDEVCDVQEGARLSYFEMLSELINQDSGGNDVTRHTGILARQKGYSGIRFLGARAITDQRPYIDGNYPYEAGIPVVHMRFREMRARPDLINYVFFSGSKLVRSIKSYSVDGGEMIANRWYGASAEELDAVSPEGFQLEDSGESIIILRKPSFVLNA